MILEVKELNKSYGNKQILTDINFKVFSGSTLGLLGRNGHGKTTTMKAIMGIITSDSGNITVDDIPIKKTDLKLGYLPEERGLYQKIKIIEQMVYFGKLRGLTAKESKKASINLLEKLEMTEYINQKAEILSKGNQQKIQLAIAVLNEPDILILDEPYSGLDPVNSRLLQTIIEENTKKNKIILFSSHQLNTVEEFCKDICIINHGKVLINGNLREIKNMYPKNRLQIVPNISNDEELLKIIADMNEYIESYEKTENGVILHLKDYGYKSKILNDILSKIDIISFSVIEPTLLEIFLERIGNA